MTPHLSSPFLTVTHDKSSRILCDGHPRTVTGLLEKKKKKTMTWALPLPAYQESLCCRLHRTGVSRGLEGQPILSSHTLPNHPSPEKRTCQLWGTFLQRAAATVYSLDAEPAEKARCECASA